MIIRHNLSKLIRLKFKKMYNPIISLIVLAHSQYSITNLKGDNFCISTKSSY